MVGVVCGMHYYPAFKYDRSRLLFDSMQICQAGQPVSRLLSCKFVGFDFVVDPDWLTIEPMTVRFIQYII